MRRQVGKNCYMVLIHKKKSLTEEEKAAEKLKEQERALGVQDEYQVKGFELVSWVQDHKGLVTGVIVAVFLGGALLSGYAYYTQRTQEAAASAYIEALQPVEGLQPGAENQEKWREVQNNLVALAKKHPNAGPALMAEIYAGHIALENKEPATAVELYATALKKMNTKDHLYLLALIGSGYAEESNGNLKGALARFAEAVDLKVGPNMELALWEAARLARDTQEVERAKGYASRLLEEFPASIFEKNAKQLRQSL